MPRFAWMLCLASALWVFAIVSAPRAIVSNDRVLSLSGAAIYSAGHFICHQRPDRCFHMAGRPMPVCARCTGLYAAAAAGAPLALLFALSTPARRAQRILLFAAIPTVLTWSIEYAGFAHFSNAARALCALPLGFAAAWLVMAGLVVSRPAATR